MHPWERVEECRSPPMNPVPEARLPLPPCTHVPCPRSSSSFLVHPALATVPPHRRFSRSGMEELASMEQRLVGLGPRALADADEAVQRALAAVLDTQWPARRWPVYVFMAGAVVCLATSSLCHLFGCCAAHVSTRIWRLDYAGIAVLTVTSFYPPVYYGFMCAPATRAAYLAASTGLGLAALAVTLLPFFQRPSYHRVRAATFAALGLWGVVPLLHASLLNAGVKEVQAAITLDVVMGVIYLVGWSGWVSAGRVERGGLLP